MALRIFLYEFVTGGGMFSAAPGEVPAGSLLCEGAAMFASLAEDFARLPDTEVVALGDARLTRTDSSGINIYPVTNAEDESSQFDSLAASAVWTIVIAPEFDEHLLNRTRRVEELGGRLLGPDSRIVELGTYKESTIAHLARHGIRTPHGYRFSAGSPIPAALRFPAILKPHDGAGSQGIQRIENRGSFPRIPAGTYRLEEFQPGTPASVAVLCGPNSPIALPACRQHLAEDGSFAYRGGKVPLDEPLRVRAERLALKVAGTLPSCRGYIGIDMVLGSSGEFDAVLELNPRMTTSYVGLRRLARCNLASAMIDAAEGETPDLCFDAEPVEFSADGTILQG
ncbi:MAG: ATP-grasp domain-containing protein [Planctomycetota bacterium]|nr:ATP-grasp domain-containing protein [Planctomycetota bacterium]